LISLFANVDVALAFLQAKLAVGSVESVESVRPVESAKSPANPKPKQSKTLSPPVLAELVTGKMEFNIKINELPTDIEISAEKRVAFVIDTDPDQVKVVFRLKTCSMWQKAATDYPVWVAAISSQLGAEFDGGFELLEPGVQIFEKRPKESKKSKDKSL
jgi:ProP effector